MSKQPSIDDPAYWRQRATESRRIADRLDDPVQKSTMLEIADGYERLAELAEKTTHAQGEMTARTVRHVRTRLWSIRRISCGT